MAASSIPFARGVCGAAARTGEVQLVPTSRPSPATSPAPPPPGRNSCCRCATRAGRLIGVLDIDSDRPAAFTQDDAEGLTRLLTSVFGARQFAAPVPA